MANDFDDDEVDRFLAWFAKRHAEKSRDLCPRCARWAIDPRSLFGWCATCTTERQIELDAADERERARQKRWWDEFGREWRENRREAAKPEESASDA